MKVLLIGKTKGSGVKRLKEELERKGHEMRVISSFSLVTSMGENEFSLSNETGEDMLDFDVYLFRGVASRLGEEVGIIANELKKRGKVIVEPARAEGRVMSVDKLVFPPEQEFLVPDFKLFLGEEVYQRNKNDFTFPLIAKSTKGSMGRNVRLVRDVEELDGAIAELGFPIIVQKYLPIKYDIRALVIDGKILGAFSRYNSDEDFLTTKPGGRREKIEISNDIREAVLSATSVSGIKIAGVDLMEYEDKVYVLEVNASPQFGIFEKITGVNVAAEIVSYLEEEYRKVKQNTV